MDDLRFLLNELDRLEAGQAATRERTQKAAYEEV